MKYAIALVVLVFAGCTVKQDSPAPLAQTQQQQPLVIREQLRPATVIIERPEYIRPVPVVPGPVYVQPMRPGVNLNLDLDIGGRGHGHEHRR